MSSETITALVDLELERTVLGQVLAFNLWAAFEEKGLTDDDFFRQEHQLVWAAAGAVHDAGGSVDLRTAGQVLRDRGQLEQVKASYLSSLLDGVPRPNDVNILLAVARLQELAAGRLASYAASLLNETLKEPGALSDGAIVQHLDRLQQIVERKPTATAPWLDVEGQLRAHQQDVTHTSDYKVHLYLSGLDGAIDGLHAGEVCGLMGRPGIGKTVFLSHIARAAAEWHGHVFFSLEMPGSQIVGRLKQMLYGVGRYDLERSARAGALDDEAYRAAFQNLVIVDTPGLSVADMGRRLRQIANGPLKGVPIRLITIDHLGLIGGDRGLSTYDRVSTQAREIKELAKRTESAVLLAVQVNREAGGDGSRELGLGSARDSGVIEEAMDYLIGIRRLDRSLTLSQFEREKYKDVIFAKVIKNRHGDPQAHEIAYRFNPVGLQLHEDRNLRADENDIGRIAAARSGGRR